MTEVDKRIEELGFKIDEIDDVCGYITYYKKEKKLLYYFFLKKRKKNAKHNDCFCIPKISKKSTLSFQILLF